MPDNQFAVRCFPTHGLAELHFKRLIPEVHMSLRTAGVFLATLLIAARLTAQSNDVASRDMYRLAIIAFADSNGIAMSDIVVDTLHSGRAPKRGPVQDWPEMISRSAIREMAHSMGFQLAGDLEGFGLPGGDSTCASCAEHKPIVAMLIFGPWIHGDSAAITSRWIRIGKTRDISGLQRFIFGRSGGAWTLKRSVVETSEEREHTTQ